MGRSDAGSAGGASNLWWGPISSSRQAGEIVRWTAGSLLLLGLAPIAAVSASLLRGELSLSWPLWNNFGQNWLVIGQVAYALIQIGAAASLLKTRSWTSAMILMACCVFVIAIVAATVLRLVGEADALGVAAEDGVLLVALAFFLRLIWRAMAATQSLRRLQTSEHFV